MFSRMRNLGSSIGISIVVTLLARNTQRVHAALAENVTPFNPMLRSPWMPHAWNLDSVLGAVTFNGELTRQAATIAYLTDFRLMMWVVLACLPLLPLLPLGRAHV